jgi:hypothetical protein
MVFENLNLNGIIGIMLIFIAVFMIVSAGTWLISFFRKSKKNPNILENKRANSEILKQELTK